MGNFVSKPPFDLTEFLSKPGSPKSNRNRRFGNTNFRPREAVEETPAAADAEADEAAMAGADETAVKEDGKA